LVDSKGDLSNVLIYVKEGLGRRRYTAPEDPVKLRRRDCRFEPHVLGVMATQPIAISNEDPTWHRVEARPKVNAEAHYMQPAGLTGFHSFKRPEVGIRITCPLHPWMSAFVTVLDSPFYSVSGPDGHFSLDRLPAGDYTLEAWHEKFGTQLVHVRMRDGETARVQITFAVTGS
jgi:hypothetical protein